MNINYYGIRGKYIDSLDEDNDKLSIRNKLFGPYTFSTFKFLFIRKIYEYSKKYYYDLCSGYKVYYICG